VTSLAMNSDIKTNKPKTAGAIEKISIQTGSRLNEKFILRITFRVGAVASANN
jgi:hypothetical protein